MARPTVSGGTYAAMMQYKTPIRASIHRMSQMRDTANNTFENLKAPASGPARALLVLLLVVVTVFAGTSDGSAGRKSRSGRWTATDLQLFNPNFADSAASVEWHTAAGDLAATLPAAVSLRSSRYYTVEASGLITPGFIGGVEVVSATYELYGIVTHFDKGDGAPAFERGNEHYEIRDTSEGGLSLEAPLIIEDGRQHTNISILNPADNGPVQLTIELYSNAGAASAYNQTIVGNALFEISPTFVTVGPFIGSARILSDKPVEAYISIYDGATQGGYSAIRSEGSLAGTNRANSASSVSAEAPQGYFPNLQPTDDVSATQSLYAVNVGTVPATITISSRFGALFTATVAPRAQFSTVVPFTKTVTEIFVAASQPVQSAIVVSDSVVTDTLGAAGVTGFVVYPMQNELNRALAGTAQMVAAQPARQAAQPAQTQAAAQADAGPLYCAVAPTLYGGYNGWQTALKLLNPLTTTGTVTVTFFPALQASEAVSQVVTVRSLPPSTSVSPNYVAISGSDAPWSAYIESTVPFYGDATSTKVGETDGIMSYRIEPVTCVQQTWHLYVPWVLKEID